MGFAPFRKVHSKTGTGRFQVSEGITPSEWMLAHPGLPTLFHDTEDDRFEIVMPKGCILTVVKDDNDVSWVAPANGTDSSVSWDDNNVGGQATPGGEDGFTVEAESTPIGCAQYNLYRPFDKGTSQGAGWVAQAYVEWPLVEGLNDDLEPGDLVRADAIGRPVKFDKGDVADAPWLQVGKVIAIETFANNYDDQLLSYMQLPKEANTALEYVYKIQHDGPNQGLVTRANLDVPNAVGAVRVNLTL